MKETTVTLVTGVGSFFVEERLGLVKLTAAEVGTLKKALAILEQGRELIENEHDDDYTDWAHAETWLGSIVRELDKGAGGWPLGKKNGGA